MSVEIKNISVEVVLSMNNVSVDTDITFGTDLSSPAFGGLDNVNSLTCVNNNTCCTVRFRCMWEECTKVLLVL